MQDWQNNLPHRRRLMCDYLQAILALDDDNEAVREAARIVIEKRREELAG